MSGSPRWTARLQSANLAFSSWPRVSQSPSLSHLETLALRGLPTSRRTRAAAAGHQFHPCDSTYPGGEPSAHFRTFGCYVSGVRRFHILRSYFSFTLGILPTREESQQGPSAPSDAMCQAFGDSIFSSRNSEVRRGCLEGRPGTCARLRRWTPGAEFVPWAALRVCGSFPPTHRRRPVWAFLSNWDSRPLSEKGLPRGPSRLPAFPAGS